MVLCVLPIINPMKKPLWKREIIANRGYLLRFIKFANIVVSALTVWLLNIGGAKAVVDLTIKEFGLLLKVHTQQDLLYAPLRIIAMIFELTEQHSQLTWWIIPLRQFAMWYECGYKSPATMTECACKI